MENSHYKFIEQVSLALKARSVEKILGEQAAQRTLTNCNITVMQHGLIIAHRHTEKPGKQKGFSGVSYAWTQCTLRVLYKFTPQHLPVREADTETLMDYSRLLDDRNYST